MSLKCPEARAITLFLLNHFLFVSHRLRSCDLISSELSHVSPSHASSPAEPDFHRSLGIPALTHQHTQLADERPRLSLLRHQLAHGPALHGVSRHGLRPQCQPTGRPGVCNLSSFFLLNLTADFGFAFSSTPFDFSLSLSLFFSLKYRTMFRQLNALKKILTNLIISFSARF